MRRLIGRLFGVQRWLRVRTTVSLATSIRTIA